MAWKIEIVEVPDDDPSALSPKELVDLGPILEPYVGKPTEGSTEHIRVWRKFWVDLNKARKASL